MRLRRNGLVLTLLIAAVLVVTKGASTDVVIPPWDLVSLLPNDTQAGLGHLLLDPSGNHEGFYLQTGPEYPWDPGTRTGAYSNGGAVSELAGPDCPAVFAGVPADYGRPGAGRDYQTWTSTGLVYLGGQSFGAHPYSSPPDGCAYTTFSFPYAPPALPRTLAAGGMWDSGIIPSGISYIWYWDRYGNLLASFTNPSTLVRFTLNEDTTTFPGRTTLRYEAFLSCTATECDTLSGPIATGGAKKDTRWLTRDPGTVFGGVPTVTGNHFGKGLARATFVLWDDTIKTFDRRCWTNIGNSACDVFADVPTSHPFFAYIGSLVKAGVDYGCYSVPAWFCPDTGTVRDQMSALLLRSKFSGFYVPPAVSTPCFADVPTSHPFAPWICDIKARGITSGCGGGNYCPTTGVSRRDMAIFLLRTLNGGGYQPPGLSTPCFADVPLSDYGAPWICDLSARGITSGCGGGNYCPNNIVTRGQMAVFLQRTFSLPF